MSRWRSGRRDKEKVALLVAYRDFALVNSRLPLIHGLQSAGYEVVVAAAAEGYQELLESAGVTVERLSLRRGGVALVDDAGVMVHLGRVVGRYKPALVHLFNSKPVILGSAAGLAHPRTKVVSTITGLGYNPGGSRFVSRGVGVGYRVVGLRSSAVIFQNRDDKEEFLRRGWVRGRKSHLIVSSGVDTGRFRPASAAGTGIGQGGGVVALMVARLTHQKGVGEFLEAARRLASHRAEVQCVLGGEWSCHPDGVRREVVEGAVNRKEVRFLGYIRDMVSVLRSASMFVFPSFYREGVPRVLLEAAACGLPVIAADVPGSREAVRQGETGVLVPPRDPLALADAITTLSRDPGLRKEMGEAGRAMVEAEFDIEAVTSRQLEVYREIGVLSAEELANGRARAERKKGTRSEE